MNRPKWNRKAKRSLDPLIDDQARPAHLPPPPYKVIRVQPRSKKKKHQGYTVLPKHRLWIFEK